MRGPLAVAVGNYATLLRSTDYGITWFSNSGSESPAEWCSVSFIDDRTIISAARNGGLGISTYLGITWSTARITLHRGYYTIGFYDVLGRKVTTLFEGKLDASEHSVDLDATELKNGIYFYRLVINGEMQTKKLIVEHQ